MRGHEKEMMEKMSDWKSVLKEDPTGWLLERDNPSVRYFTLTDVLEKDTSSVDVPRILAKQKSGGYWGIAENFYQGNGGKYKGTVWQLIILAELGANANDERVKKACEFILLNSQDRESGGFSVWPSAKAKGGRHSGVIPCLTGNEVWSLIRLGYLDDPRVRKAIDWITTFQRFDDGIDESPKGWPYDRNKDCFGTHTCHMGVVKALRALAEIPVEKRSEDVVKTIRDGVEHMLKHHVHKRSHDLSRVSKPGWLRFGFPLMYQTDVLEILGILTKLGYRDKRMQEAVDLVVSKQDSQGRWKMENTFNDRFHVSIEQKGKSSKWITLKALEVLKEFYG
jgi:hypothetical protein